MKSKYGKTILIIGVVFLFILSSIIPMVVGYYQQKNLKKEILNEDINVLSFDLESDFADISDDSKKLYNYFKEELLKCSWEFKEGNSEIGGICNFIKPLQKPINSIGLMDSPWPMKSHDIRHTGLSPYSTENVDGLEKWRFRCSWVLAGITIDDNNNSYFGDASWDFYILTSDGIPKWSFHTGSTILSTPVIAVDGTIYIGSYDDFLYAFNPNGSLKWRFDTEASISSSPAIAYDGTIYFGTMWSGGNGGKIYALNPDGTLKWVYQTSDFVESDPAIGADGTVYIGSGDSYLYAMNPNGTLQWRFKTGEEIHGHPSIAEDGTIYISSFDDYLYAINPDGTEKWRYNTVRGSSAGHAIGEDGTIYVGSDDLYAIYPDGTLKWIFNLDGYYIGESSPAISTEGTIYIGISEGIPGYPQDGEIIAINPDGTEKWRKRIGNSGWIDSSPSIGIDGTVYIGSTCDGSRGYLHAFGPVDSNSPPDIPTIIGELNGHPRTEYWYDFKSIDPDNNPVHYIIDWGDGNTEETPERASGEEAGYSHTWILRGTYTIKAKAIDTLGEESDWGYLEVSMPLNQPIPRYSFPIIQRILDLFPNVFQILRQLIG